jgi:ubiquinone/menaquinone biosynthesis C-methylase UbiE
MSNNSMTKPNDDYELQKEHDLSQLSIVPRGRNEPNPMTHRDKPDSLEGRWDILYRDYPEVYDEFERIPKVPDLIDVLDARFPLQGKTVVDVGSGTGLSTFRLARYAAFVIGIEIEEAMIAIARENAQARGVDNVRFQLGDAERLPFEDCSVDAAVAMWLAGGDVRAVALEMERVVRPGGLVLRADVAPGWYGGELNPVITGRPRDETAPVRSRDHVLAELGHEAMDVYMDQDYKTVESAVRTYGFVHSARAIDYIRAQHVTTIRWKARARFKTVT